MAVYAYRCEACEHEFEVRERISEHGRRKPSCPKCESGKVERVFTPSFVKTARKS